MYLLKSLTRHLMHALQVWVILNSKNFEGTNELEILFFKTRNILNLKSNKFSKII